MATTEGKSEKEGSNLLGSPTFKKLDNGRFKCVESGHELFAKDMESYSQSKRCRLGLIDFALSHKKPPLNMFKQDPLLRSKLKCKLTGDTVNKSEEHIWKHINGKRFLNKLEQKEMETLSGGTVEEEGFQKPQKVPKPSTDDEKEEKKKNKRKRKKDKGVKEIISEVRTSSNGVGDFEEPEFWMPPVGDRWDFDDGGDRWDSGLESEQESEEDNGMEGTVDEVSKESEEDFVRTKRISIEIGPSSSASRKKKSKQSQPC
ncbi:surfeit locus protein 2-like [Quillaja saponaria]|uniref:Surfeit locus protein 2-like n=1 Tax=Quillaja saponaria TaxID=32244 RepID=A0AAD7Q4I4_QUISA|nr:surfeit locus protein 2-like [Quillaja saponaria]